MGPRPALWFRWPLIVWAALGLCFFGSLLLAAAFSPRRYHWSRDVISSLASPRDNPHAYGIACAGLALSGLLLLPFPLFLRMRMEPFAPHTTAWAGKFFFMGAVSLALSALFVPGHYRILGLGRTHEHLAQVSGVAFCVALLLYFGAILRLPRSSLRLAAGFIVLLPVTALIVSRLSLFLAWRFSSPPDYLAIRTSLWSSLALWEWVGAVCVYLFLGLLTLAPFSGRSDE